ncbi:NAD(P)H-dependent flavin oxidoreductase [Burkholderia plantarii]|uniref:Nitronate monooxygenase n=1 Tax=Burkholderia plantarii TaxID=41899 RepID=A0A0B6S1P8_BURPL|nr:nitronate monooxygenase [Burkholderia plantarii]AJK46161.1 putative dioxygenase protein [Burkholderia plantarii]ALK30429.1 putative dioxygenase protein [Burkholderia plantarii]WLE59122.1 nitronate monooxygenase [Burkholderia plantarii]GLZ18543.1 2-nitropropane dioxygenase [Burkholderia plantarii]
MGNGQDTRILDLFGVELPIIQAPMAGATTVAMVIAASEAGGLGSLPAALLSVEQMKAALDEIRGATRKPINVNFFSHTDPAPDPAAQMAWRAALARYYVELGLDPAEPVPSSSRAPFNDAYCEIVEAYRPEVVSFHFGLPEARLVERVKRAGARVISSATTVAEARWLAERGVDAIIAMGYEAGGHRGNFLSDDMSTQVGTIALVPQIVDAVPVPVIAAGGIADPRGVRAAFALGASAVQVGTAYLLTPEAKLSAFHREALRTAGEDQTALTNLFTGRPARGITNRLMREIGPISAAAPVFPTAGGALVPLRAVTEKAGKADFSNMWAGQAARLAREMSTAELTRYLVGAAG